MPFRRCARSINDMFPAVRFCRFSQRTVSEMLTASGRGQDKRGRRRSAAISHSQLSWDVATYSNMCALETNYGNGHGNSKGSGHGVYSCCLKHKHNTKCCLLCVLFSKGSGHGNRSAAADRGLYCTIV